MREKAKTLIAEKGFSGLAPLKPFPFPKHTRSAHGKYTDPLFPLPTACSGTGKGRTA